MKNLTLSLGIAFLLTVQANANDQEPSFASANASISTYTANANILQEQGGNSPEKTKLFSKSFSLDRNDKINLSNQYGGSITIKTWDKNEVKVDAELKAYARTDNDAQKMLDEVSINATKSGDLVTYTTEMPNRNRSWGSSVKNGKTLWRKEVKIYYTVYMPSSNALTASQKYGNILMGDFSGPTSIKVQYGNFTAGNLSNSNNYVNVQYGDTNIQEASRAVVKQQYGKMVTIGTVGTLDLNVQYAGTNISTIKGDAVIKKQYGNGMLIGSVNNLNLDAQYTNVNITTINGDATIRQQYNKLHLGKVGKLKLDAQYVGTTIGNLKGDGVFDLQYNNLCVGYISPACRSLTIKSQYVDVNLGFTDAYNANFEVTKNYGTFKYGSNVDARLLSDQSQTKRYSGKIGNGGAGNVKINAGYGTLTFK